MLRTKKNNYKRRNLTKKQLGGGRIAEAFNNEITTEWNKLYGDEETFYYSSSPSESILGSNLEDSYKDQKLSIKITNVNIKDKNITFKIGSHQHEVNNEDLFINLQKQYKKYKKYKKNLKKIVLLKRKKKININSNIKNIISEVLLSIYDFLIKELDPKNESPYISMKSINNKAFEKKRMEFMGEIEGKNLLENVQDLTQEKAIELLEKEFARRLKKPLFLINTSPNKYVLNTSYGFTANQGRQSYKIPVAGNARVFLQNQTPWMVPLNTNV